MMCHEMGKKKEACRELPVQSFYKMVMAHFSPSLFLKNSPQCCYPPPSPSPWWESYMYIIQDGAKQGPKCSIMPCEVRQGENGTSSRMKKWAMLFCLPRIQPSFFWSEHLGFLSENVSSPLSVHRVGMSLTHSPTKYWDPDLLNPPLQITMIGSGMDIRIKSVQQGSDLEFLLQPLGKRALFLRGLSD